MSLHATSSFGSLFEDKLYAKARSRSVLSRAIDAFRIILNRGDRHSQRHVIQIKERRQLGEKQVLLLVSVDGERVLLGSGPMGTTLLCRLHGEDNVHPASSSRRGDRT